MPEMTERPRAWFPWGLGLGPQVKMHHDQAKREARAD
jgi:hypothetical protein